MDKFDLKNKWEKEKEAYKKMEVGSGVQKFVKDFLKSEDFFNLSEGTISKKLQDRCNEFTEESPTKASRRADIIIYVSPEIIIPVEVEKFGSIEDGLDQLLQYQLDIDKKYGILTDGNAWRFYNNGYLLKEFNLKQIFDSPNLFNEFWQEYIKPENYYLSFFEEKGQLKFFPEDLSIGKKRQDFFRDITTLIKSFKNKLQIEGYLEGTDKKQKEKIAVEITYAYIIQFILYKTLVDNDFGNFKKEFEAKVQKIYEHIKEKNYRDILGIIDDISANISKNIYRPFAKEQQFINEKLLQIFHSLENRLADVSPWLDIFIFIKKYNFANVKNEIFGYIYENYLKELYEDTKKGQYFTDPEVVNFMLKQIGYDSEGVKNRLKEKPENDYISIIDPSCGSGTFLYSAVNQIIEAIPNGSEQTSKKIEEIIDENVFGLDIAEFPLYLAEMNILMRMLPLIINEKYNNPIDKKIKVFKTNDSVAEFINTNLKNTFHHFETEGKRQFSLLEFKKTIDLGYTSYMREESDLEEMKESMEQVPGVLRRRFDFVIGNPPYISYNECSQQGIKIFELMKKGEAKLNNIYGVNLHSIPGNQKKYRPNPNFYSFFIALGLALLKDCGKLCYIIPQTVLTAGDLDVIRYYLATNTTIEKIITFSGKMFIGRGLKQDKPVATSSLVFVCSKRTPAILHQVEIINHKDEDKNIEDALKDILSGEKNRKISKKKILQNKLLQNVANWNFIKQSDDFINFSERYKQNTDSISFYYEHHTAQSVFGSRFYFDGGYDIDERKTLEQPIENILNYKIPHISRKFWTIKNYKGYWPNIRREGDKMFIYLRQGNQEYNFLDSTYKIIWSYMNFDRFHFSKVPIIWPRNQMLGIGSENKNELLYIFSLLNSKVVNNVLEKSLKIENEKDFLVSLTSIKEFVRVPKITEDKQKIKDEVVKQTEEMLALEEFKLSDFVDFSKVMIQKFDNVFVEEQKLILEKENKKIKLLIKNEEKLVGKVVNEKYGKKGLSLEKSKIDLRELKNLPVINFEKQQKIKDYIDDLVFSLYFNIGLEALGLNKAEKIKDKCSKNLYYKLVNK